MTFVHRISVLALTAVLGVVALASGQAVNDLPNPYTTHQDHFTLPDGRTWGSTSAVDIAPTARPSGWVNGAVPTAAPGLTWTPFCSSTLRAMS